MEHVYISIEHRGVICISIEHLSFFNSSYLCSSECDIISRWQFFMSRYIFVHQVFRIQVRFLYIYVKTIYSLSMSSDIFSCQVYVQNFIHQERLVTSSGLTTGESGNWTQERQHRGGQFLHSQRRRVFRKYLVYFQSMQRMPGGAWWRPSWVLIEKTRTVWRNITCHVSTQNRITSWPRGSQMRHRATFERPTIKHFQ